MRATILEVHVRLVGRAVWMRLVQFRGRWVHIVPHVECAIGTMQAVGSESSLQALAIKHPAAIVLTDKSRGISAEIVSNCAETQRLQFRPVGLDSVMDKSGHCH